MRRVVLLIALSFAISGSAWGQVFGGADIETAGMNADAGVDPMIEELAAGERLLGERPEWGDDGWRGNLADTPPGQWTVGMWGSAFCGFSAVERIGDTEYVLQAREGKSRATVLLTGLDTSKITDGVVFCLQHPVVISGTRTLPDSNERVLVLDASFDAVSAKKADLSFRLWKDVSGSFSVEAKFIRYLNKEVTLQKKDGSQVTVPLNRLSDADRKFAIAEHEKAKKNP